MKIAPFLSHRAFTHECPNGPLGKALGNLDSCYLVSKWLWSSLREILLSSQHVLRFRNEKPLRKQQMRLDHIESPSHLPVDCTGKSRFSSHFTLLHLSDHDDFQPSVTCRCFTHHSSESANLKQMKSIYFLQRRLTLRSQGYLNDQLAGSNFSWHQAKVAGAALIYCYLCPRVGTDGTFWQRVFLAGKHPLDWDAHSFTCLKIMCREQTVEKNTEAKPNYILLCMQYLIDHLDDSFGCLGFTALPRELRVGECYFWK